jgi:histidyl-tRNA synthetase
MGLERLLELVQAQAAPAAEAAGLYVLAINDALEPSALALAESLRIACPQWRVLFHVGGGSLKSRMKKADRSGAQVALILGEDEAARDEVTLKPLRRELPQAAYPQSDIAEVLVRLLAGQAGGAAPDQ